MNLTFKKYFVGELSIKRFVISLVLIPVFVYLGLSVLVYFYAERLIFQPQTPLYRDSSEIIKLTTSDNEKISAKFYENPNARYVILFSHGNAEDIGGLDSILKDFQKSDFAVFSFDYRGYGTSEGAPTEEKAYRDIEAAYAYLINELKFPPEKIIAHGRSLGGAVAINLASRKKSGGLIVESSFVSAYRVLTKIQIFPFDQFQSIKRIRDVNCPVLIIHGRKDDIVPFWHGEKLYAAAKDPKFSFWIDTAGHNNVYSTSKTAYLQAIRDFADNLPK
ncbi:MAG TPA: alpha/beta hydrolase [Pyrinomonadaceae bacterium]